MRLAKKAMLAALPFGKVYSWNLTQVLKAGDPVTSTTNITNTSLTFPFFVENCGLLGANVLELLQQAIDILPSVILDLTLGGNSRYGYKAWFKNDDALTYAAVLLQSVYTSQPKLGLLPQPQRPTRPRFSCVTPSTVHMYPWVAVDPYYACIHLSPEMGAYYYEGSSYIFLCPLFWLRQPEPARSNCPRVIHNRFVGNRALLSDYKTYILIHEMLHFYLGGDSLTPHTLPTEKYELNECVALDTLDSLHNPSNYQYYIAMVEQHCTEFPDPDRPPWLPMEGNSTAQTTLSNSSLPLGSSNSSPMASDGTIVGTLPQATSLALPDTQDPCNSGLGQPLACVTSPVGDS